MTVATFDRFLSLRRRVGLLLLTSFFAFLPTFFIPFLHIDEGGWAALGPDAFTGNIYQTVSDHKPPFMFQLHWLVTLGEHSILSLRVFIVLWTFLGGLALFSVLRSYFEERWALIAAWLYCLLSGMINYGAYSAERTYIPFLLIATYFAQRYFESTQTNRSSRSFGWAFGLGICVGAAASIKQTAFLLGSIPFLILLFSASPISAISIGILGIFAFTFTSWALARVPFSLIWSEGYMANFKYMAFDNAPAILDILKNAAAIFLLYYVALVIGSIASAKFLWQDFVKNIREGRIWERECFRRSSLLIALLVMGAISVRLGGRFYQQYYVVILPSLALLTAYALSRIQSRAFRRFILGASLFTVCAFHLNTWRMQVFGENKNWDAEELRLVEAIDEDTKPNDTIWVSQGLLPPYFASNRKPAVKYIYFAQALGYTDVCRADESTLHENLADPNYSDTVNRLKMNRPKVIFWVQRHTNSCSDRLKLENFPSISSLLKEQYEEVWTSPLGLYFRRKSNS